MRRPPWKLIGLAGLAGVAAREGQHDRAARLAGAVDTLLDAAGHALWPADRAQLDRTLEAARSALGEEVVARAHAQGRALSLERAMAEAREAAKGSP